MERVSRDQPRFKNELDAVVFICKQFWVHAFNKQIDNLKTNHQVGIAGTVRGGGGFQKIPLGLLSIVWV